MAVRQRIFALRTSTRDNLHIAARYAAMVKLEAILVDQIAAAAPRS